MTKYNNRKVEIDGYKFDSVLEGLRYQILKDRVKKGEISDLRIQPEFTLNDYETTYHKLDIAYNQVVTRRKFNTKFVYRADYSYYDPKYGDVVEDVKCEATRTKSYILKMKCFLNDFPNKHFIEIHKDKEVHYQKS